MRITLHAVAADDHPTLHAAMQEHAAGGPAQRPALPADRSDARRRRARRAGPARVPRDGPVERRDMEAVVAEARLGAVPKPVPWWALRSTAPSSTRRPADRGRSGQRPSYCGITDRADADRTARAVPAARVALPRGLRTGDAPRTSPVRDAPQPRVRAALAALADQLRALEGPEGECCSTSPTVPDPTAETPAPPRLMAMWDSSCWPTPIAAGGAARVPPARHPPQRRRAADAARRRLRRGVWRPAEGGIEATAFHGPGRRWDGLATEAPRSWRCSPTASRPSTAGTRRWWATCPSAEVRTLS